MPKICFIENQIYSVLNPGYGGPSSGGEAVQHSLLAREFANQGWTVSAVCRDAGQPDGDVISGVRFWKTYKRDSGLAGIRFLYPRLYTVWNALRKADADIYFQSCAGFMTGVVANFVRRNQRKMVFRVAHDTDCIPGAQLINNVRDRWLYEYGLKSADLISVQSAVQASALEENYGLESVGVNMIVEPPDDSTDVEKDIDVLWVNNMRDFKRPGIVCEIARSLPDVNFVMIGGRIKGHERHFTETKCAAESIPNLTVTGAIPYNLVNGYFSRAKLFLNTSDSEGFPNSFLQAWIRRLPVVSYFDPDGLIRSLDIGAAVPSQNEFCTAIIDLLKSEDRRIAIGERARQFAVDNYSSAPIVRHYQSLFKDEFQVEM